MTQPFQFSGYCTPFKSIPLYYCWQHFPETLHPLAGVDSEGYTSFADALVYHCVTDLLNPMPLAQDQSSFRMLRSLG